MIIWWCNFYINASFDRNFARKFFQNPYLNLRSARCPFWNPLVLCSMVIFDCYFRGFETFNKFKIWKLEFSKIGSRFVFPICRKKSPSATKSSRKWPFQILIFEKLPVRWRDRTWFASRLANFFLIAREAD